MPIFRCYWCDVYSNLLFRNIFVQYLLGYCYKHSNSVMLVSPMTTIGQKELMFGWQFADLGCEATLPAAGIWSDLESPINEVRLADLETQR